MNRLNGLKGIVLLAAMLLGGAAQAQVLVHGSVYGAGKGTYPGIDVARVGGNTEVDMSAGRVMQNVYGGGKLGSVDGNTLVQISGTAWVGALASTEQDGFVFGGGSGTIEDPLYAAVLGNTHVVMTGGTVHNTLFGGGELASVGTLTRAAAADDNNDIIVGEPTDCASGTGRCLVEISGGQVGHTDATMLNDIGYVFGAGMGVYTDPHDPAGAEHAADAQKFGYVNTAHVVISGSALVCGAVWGGSENGQVLDSCGVRVEGGQIGCGYDWASGTGHAAYSEAQWTTAVNAVKGQMAANADLTVVTSAINAAAGTIHECYHWPYGRDSILANGDHMTHYLPYDPYAYLYHATDASNHAGDGHTFFGNVFGGGSGYYPYLVETTPDVYEVHWYPFQGRVRGNSYVEITGGHILTSVYGGCEYADVKGDCRVDMSGGTLGVPRTLDSIADHPVTCYLFGAGKGDQRTTFNQRTNVGNVKVKVHGDAMVFGSVFGGGEDGHVTGDCSVNIYGDAWVGTWGTSYVDGNIFGAGRGFGGTAVTAGSVEGNVEVNISTTDATLAGYPHMLGSVYGGGRLASVGVYMVGSDDTEHYGRLIGNCGEADADALAPLHGNIKVNIGGGTVGNGFEFTHPEFDDNTAYTAGDMVYYDNHLWTFLNDHIGDWDEDAVTDIVHTTGGNVFGGSMGRLLNIGTTDASVAANFNPLWPGLAKCRSTEVNITGTARVYSSVYGGGELGYVMKDTKVTVGDVGTTDGSAVEIGHQGGTGLGVTYFGSVYGGGYGSDNITAHDNDTASISGSVTAAMHAGRVYGNAEVAMNDGHVMGNIYGGGEMASVGRRWINMALNGDADNYLPYNGSDATSTYTAGGETYTAYGLDEHVGHTKVTISGGSVVGEFTDTVVGTNRYAGWVAGKKGGVFGGGKGRPGYIDESTDENHDFHFTRMAYVDKAEVLISGGTMAAVFGGGENGHVRYDTKVTMTAGTVGLPLHGKEADMDRYGYSPVVVYHGNVYGGGRGVDRVQAGHLGAAAGQVFGNTEVEISGGTVTHNVYGGGSVATVGTPVTENDVTQLKDGTGDARVTIKGTAVIGDAASKGHDSGRIFGSGRGVASTEYASRAYTRNTYVTIDGSCHVYGDVFGSGENGHVEDHTHVYIKGGQIGEYWADLEEPHNEYVGNVYGGGRGVDPDGGAISRTAGLVHGATHITVTGGHIYHNIYGGGSLANVGDTLAVSGFAGFADTVGHDQGYDYVAADLTEEDFDAATNNGHAYIYIRGGKIGIDGANNGRVFGGGRGNAGLSNFKPFVETEPTGYLLQSGTSDIYYRSVGGKILSYRKTKKSEFDYDREDDDIWVVGKVRKNASTAYEDSVIVRDYTNHTYVTGTHIVVKYPSVDSTTVSTSYPTYADSLAAAATNTASSDYIRGCVFGGGDNGHVRGNTQVVVQQGRIGTLTSNGVGNVFGGGRGEGLSYDGQYSEDAGKVYGNTHVDITGGWILHNVYGGGNMSSVGDFTVTLTGDDITSANEHDKDAWLTGVGQVAGYTTHNGWSYVTVSGGHIGEKESDIMDGTSVRAGMDSRDANLGGNVFGSSRGQSSNMTLVNRMAWANFTLVTVKEEADIQGSVFGGGENGHVFYTATVNIEGGYIGVKNTATSGDIFRGNVYAGGRGIDPVSGGHFSRNSGLILGNTYLNMSGGTVYRNIFGGGSMATVGTYTYKEGTGSDKDMITALQRTETGKTEVNITGGTVGINGANNGRVFGAGRGVAGLMHEQQMGYLTFVDRTYVTVSGDADIRGCVFGSGDNGHVLGNAQVVVAGGTIGTGNGGAVNGNVFGSGRGADTYNTGTESSPVYTLSESAGRVYGSTNVYIVGGTLKNNVYGGGYLATVDGNTHVTVANSATVDKEVYTMTGGVPTASHTTVTWSGTPEVYGDVFGGSALGELGSITGTTTVDILGGTIGNTSRHNYSTLGCGNIFGGGNGDAEGSGMDGYSNGTTSGTRAANVLNTVHVNIGNSSQYDDNSQGATVNGSVYGGNNVAGSPKGDIYVDVYSTAHTTANDFATLQTLAAEATVLDTNDLKPADSYADARFALTAVYGGGNKATVVPAATDAMAYVTIHECSENTVKYVYGGGNAADLGTSTLDVNTNVLIEGGHIYQVYAGGNGYGTGNPGANIYGDASVTVESGAIHQVFGGSNSLGMVYGTSSVNFNYDAENGAACQLVTQEVFGGGNEAPGGNTIVTIPCGTTGLTDVYGGANAADIGTIDDPKNVIINVLGGDMQRVFGGNKSAGTIYGTVTVNVFGSNPGHTISEVFGGSNLGGDIRRQIVVNIDSSRSDCPLQVDYVYGGGNEVAYAPASGYEAATPEVNLLQGTVNQAVFGGGKGTTESGHEARVTARPTVNIGDDQDLYVRVGTDGGSGALMGMVFGGGNVSPTTGNTQVVVRGKDTKVWTNVYGGGNGASAEVTGNTDVHIGSLPEGHTPTAIAALTATIDQATRTVSLATTTHGAVIRYTLDGSDPLANKDHRTYAEPVEVTGGATLRAVATRPGYTTTSEYTVGSVATPVVALEGAQATVTCATTGATLRYTLDGSEPTSESAAYSSALTLTAGQTLTVVAMKDGLVNSLAATATYEP